MNGYFTSLDEVMKERKMPSRIRFMVQDLIDLRMVSHSYLPQVCQFFINTCVKPSAPVTACVLFPSLAKLDSTAEGRATSATSEYPWGSFCGAAPMNITSHLKLPSAVVLFQDSPDYFKWLFSKIFPFANDACGSSNHYHIMDFTNLFTTSSRITYIIDHLTSSWNITSTFTSWNCPNFTATSLLSK